MYGSHAPAWRAAAICLLAATTPSLAEGDSSHAALLADAAARFSLQAEPRAGHDGRFFLASPDGLTRLQVGALLQYRYTLNARDTAAPDEDLTSGFDFRRTKLFFSGTLPVETSFYIQGAFPTSGGGFVLEFAEATHKLGERGGLTWGMFKLPFLHEELVSEKTLMATDRSIMHAVFTAGVSEGVMLCSTAESWRVMGAVSDGMGGANTAYFSPAEADLALTGRAEYRLGDSPWGAFGAFTSFRGAAPGTLLGAAVHWQTAGDTGSTLTFAGTPAVNTDTLAYTVDATHSGDGWSLYGAFVGRTTDTDASAALDDFGAIAQASVYVTDRTELFGRWDGVFPDDARAAGEDFHTITVGATHYFFPGSHAAKLTADLQWYPEDQAGSAGLVRAPSSGSQLLPESEGDQYALRVQMQSLF